MPDRSIDRWSIVGVPGRWTVQHLPNNGYGIETYESDLDEIPEVVGNDTEMKAPRRSAIKESPLATTETLHFWLRC